MAAIANLTQEERLGLGVAVAAHVALALALALQVDRAPPFSPPERMVVSLANEVSLEDTAPDPSAEPAAAFAPTLSDEPQPLPVPEVQPQRPVPREVAPPVPRPRPTASASPRPSPTPSPSPTRTSGASRIGEDFLTGNSDADGRSGSPGTTVGPAQQASIASAIIRQLKPHWTPPSGVDVDKMSTVLRFRLNPDGSLAGNPELVRQTGVTESNRAQAGRHLEQAIRAVRLAAPFNLPEQYYSGWRVITSNFDKSLAQ